MAAKGLVPCKRPISQFAVREKLEAIQRVHNGESKASVARNIGVPESTLRGWCKSEDKLRSVARSCGTPESQHSEGDVGDGGPSDMKRPRSEGHEPKPELDEALLFWLKQQNQQQPLPLDPKQPDGGSSWFWRWYKNCGFSQFPAPVADKANYSLPLATRAKSTLDSVLNNNRSGVECVVGNNVSDVSDDDEPPATAADAVGHGEKFLRWLECCSDPSVTAMQILQFRYLLNNVRACADRRAKQGKANPRSRRK